MGSVVKFATPRTAGFPVLHCLLEFAQIHVHWVDDAIYVTWKQSKGSLGGNAEGAARCFLPGKRSWWVSKPPPRPPSLPPTLPPSLLPSIHICSLELKFRGNFCQGMCFNVFIWSDKNKKTESHIWMTVSLTLLINFQWEQFWQLCNMGDHFV